MNGFTMMASDLRKQGNVKAARLYEFLGTCDDDDMCILFDSTAFNEIAKCYMRLAVRQLVDEDVIEDDQCVAVRNRFSYLFDVKRAKDVI